MIERQYGSGSTLFPIELRYRILKKLYAVCLLGGGGLQIL